MKLSRFIADFIQENEELVSRTPLVWVERIQPTDENDDIIPLPDRFPATVNFSERHIRLGRAMGFDVLDLSKGDAVLSLYDIENVDWSKTEVHVHHGFVFDMRLIPSDFKGIKVCDVTHGDMPKEFPSENCMMRHFEYYAPANYERFVDNNFENIAKTLKMKNPDKAELLNALTGNFQLHKEECESKRQMTLESHKEEVAFFHELLRKTEEAYKESEIKGNDWGYSVTATQISRGKPLIVGFNWGVDTEWVRAGNSYGAQKEYPLRTFEGNFDDLGSLKRTVEFFHEHYPQALSGMQTNFCFFRSEREDQVSEKDLELSRPLFEEYLKFSDPSVIISFSSKLRNHLVSKGRIEEVDSLYVRYMKGRLQIIKGFYLTDTESKIPFVYLPHPNSRVSGTERKNAWNFCFPIHNSETEG
jgi:hypothetical protein